MVLSPIRNCSALLGEDDGQQRHSRRNSWLSQSWMHVCARSDHTFRSSYNNKVHLRYNWSDISELDAELSAEIRSDAAHYGFND
jgi:hypothetical protein